MMYDKDTLSASDHYVRRWAAASLLNYYSSRTDMAQYFTFSIPNSHYANKLQNTIHSSLPFHRAHYATKIAA